MAEDYGKPAEPGQDGRRVLRVRQPGQTSPHDLALLVDQRELEALRGKLTQEAARSCRLPAVWRDVLVAEAVGLLDASRRYLGKLDRYGLLSANGKEVRASYREYLDLQPRLKEVMKLLGLHEVHRADRQPPPEAPDPASDPLADLDSE